MTRPAAREPELLQRRPEARAIRLEDLLSDVRLGRVRVPAFQRKLKWNRQDARKLLDSIYRGYPIGTLLFWETAAEASEVRFGSVTISAGARSDAWWVVDGQQRIVSLVRTLLTPHPSAENFAVYFDLDEQGFYFTPAPKALQAERARWLPLAVVLDSEHLIQWLLDHVRMPQHRERAIQLGKRIREYEIPGYIVRSDSELTLREVFSRMNNSGKRLAAEEVFDALHGARSTERPATLDQIAEALEHLGFGTVEQPILYRLLRVLVGVEVSDRSGEGALRLSDEEARIAYAHTSQAASEVIQFLKRDAGIPHYDLLPYKQPFVALGKFFHHHRTANARTRELLVRWLWRGALNGAHRGDIVSTRSALVRIDPTSEEASVQGMLKQVSEQQAAQPGVNEPFNFRHASSKLQALALVDLQPRDTETGRLMLPSTLFDRSLTGGSAPLSAIASKGAPDAVLKSVVNRMVHPHRKGLRSALLKSGEAAVLASHAIDDTALRRLQQGDTAGFLAQRAKVLEAHFHHFFRSHARWEESDRPSVRSLAVAEEE